MVARTLPLPVTDPEIRGRNVTVYLGVDIYNRVLSTAEAESRSLSNMIEVLIRRGLKRNPE